MKRLLSIIIAISMVICLLPQHGLAQTDIVASCNIADGATDVSNPGLTEQVSVSFNQPMSNLNGNYVKLEGLYDTVGQYTVSKDKMSISFDIKNLCPNKEYTLTLKTGLKADAGATIGTDTVLAKFKTGKIYTENGNEDTTLENISLRKTITSADNNTAINKTVDSYTGERNDGSDKDGDGRVTLTIDLAGSYVPKAFDLVLHNGYGGFSGWKIYGHNTQTADFSQMTLIGNTDEHSVTLLTGIAKYRIPLDNDEAFKYITISRSGSFYIYEATIWAPVVESLTDKNTFDIPSFDISGSQALGYEAEIKINNLTGDTTTAPKLIIAVYNGDTLVASGISEKTLVSAGSDSIDAVITPEQLEGKTVTNAKAFLLTSLNELTPIVKAIELNVNTQN